jgi:apolipoprotein N-acyltransferase
MFRMRAVECGRWLARADVAGGTSAVAPDGVETARVNTSGPARLDVVVGRSTRTTLYLLGGWRFGQLCLVALGALCVYAVARRGVKPGA